MKLIDNLAFEFLWMDFFLISKKNKPYLSEAVNTLLVSLTNISSLHNVHTRFGINYGTVLILGLHPANKRRRHKVTPSLIGWTQT